MKVAKNQSELEAMCQKNEMQCVSMHGGDYPVDVYKREGYLVAVPSGDPKPPKGSLPVPADNFLWEYIKVTGKIQADHVEMMPFIPEDERRVITNWLRNPTKQVSAEEFPYVYKCCEISNGALKHFSKVVESEKESQMLKATALSQGQKTIVVQYKMQKDSTIIEAKLADIHIPVGSRVIVTPVLMIHSLPE